jgi:hypothetical protein
VIEEGEVLRFRQWVVAMRHELGGRVPQEQRRAPAVATVASGSSDDGMVDEIGRHVDQSGFPDPQRPATEVARHAHREVVVEVDVLEHEPLAADHDLFEEGRRASLGRLERAAFGGALEELVE